LYPEPYFDKKKLDKIYEDIKGNGFGPDEFLSVEPDWPVYGLNIAFGWPLPNQLKEPYEDLYQELLTLGPDVYVYPYHQTHVTVMTLVNFKKYKNPNTEKMRNFEKFVPKIISLISRELPGKFKPFKIDVGWPVLLKNTVILPILNQTEDVYRFRKKVSPLLKKLFPREIILLYYVL
jgi:hypothetical protein